MADGPSRLKIYKKKPNYFEITQANFDSLQIIWQPWRLKILDFWANRGKTVCLREMFTKQKLFSTLKNPHLGI